MDAPKTIRNLEEWENHCRKIHARAEDFLAGRLGVIETARLLSQLAFWAHLRNDADLQTFVAIDSETGTLPVGEVRKYWAPDALEREDVNINQAEKLNQVAAAEAATRLVQRFAWAVEARNERRERGGSA
jgi:E3 ubiquitin-protein ligase DOA10